MVSLCYVYRIERFKTKKIIILKIDELENQSSEQFLCNSREDISTAEFDNLYIEIANSIFNEEKNYIADFVV